MKIKHTGVALGLLLLLVLVYWPGIVGESAMKWDATAIYLPWKLFLCRSVFSGSLPFWNPFVSGGFAQCIDPGTWYPISYLFGWGGVYDLQSLLYEYLFHVWFAALGFYFILVRLSIDWRLSASVSGVFLFNGFFVGNAQHLGWIVASTWSIWSIYFFIRLIKSDFGSSNYIPRLRCGLGLGFSMVLLFTGGYPGMFVNQVYVLLVWGILYWINRKIHGDFSWSALKIWLNYVFFAVLVFITISIPAWVSLFKYLPYLTRGNGLAAQDLMFGSFPLSKTLEWLLPKSLVQLSISDGELWDLSMIDGYWSVLLGWFLLSFLFFSKKRTIVLPWFVAGLLCWLFSMGEDLPFKYGLNIILPGMDYFRFPAQIRFWGILFWLIAAASAMLIIQKNTPKSLLIIGCLIITGESVLQGFNQRNSTVLASAGEYVDATEIRKINAKLIQPSREFIGQKQLDSVWVRPLDGPNIEPFGFLWYNKGILLNRFAKDGYNPYSFTKYEVGSKLVGGQDLLNSVRVDSIGYDSLNSGGYSSADKQNTADLRKLVTMVGGNWAINRFDLLNNNTFECVLSKVGVGGVNDGYLVVNQTGLPGWHVYRATSVKDESDRYIELNYFEQSEFFADSMDFSVDFTGKNNESVTRVNGIESKKVPSGLVIALDGNIPTDQYRLRLEFNPVMSVLGFTVNLLLLCWISVFFIVFWLCIAVYLNSKNLYARV